MAGFLMSLPRHKAETLLPVLSVSLASVDLWSWQMRPVWHVYTNNLEFARYA